MSENQISIEKDKIILIENEALSKHLKSLPTLLYAKHIYELSYFSDSNKFLSFGSGDLALDRDHRMDPIEAI